MTIIDRSPAVPRTSSALPSAHELYAARFTDELTRPPLVPLDERIRQLYVEERSVHLHSSLPPTPQWCYVAYTETGAQVNPALQAVRNRPSLIRYRNELSGRTLPIAVTAVHGTDATDGIVRVANFEGPGCPAPNFVIDRGMRSGDGSTFIPADQAPAVLAPHLHGGATEARSDGWTENLIAPGQSSVFQYSNEQPSTMLWYHDHAAHITRFTVYSGLASFYVVRDADDERITNVLQLRASHEHHAHGGCWPTYELPLLIQDLNLDIDDDGLLTGRLVHKVESGNGPMEFFGPFTMVNRQIWPKSTVERRQYRLRLLNGSNARTFSLALIDSTGTVVPWGDIATLIGTDGGLRREPLAAGDQLILAPAERLDVVVDFARVAAKHLTMVNTAKAPFGGDTVPPFLGEAPFDSTQPDAPGNDAWNGLIRFPEVMRFDLVGPPQQARPIPALSADFRRIVHEAADADPGERVVVIPDSAEPGGHRHRLIALVEEELTPGTPAVLTLRELTPYTPGDVATDRLITLTEPDPANPGQLVTRTWATAAKLFHDRGTFDVNVGEIEVWKVVNLSPDTHPFHVHLVEFQVLGRNSASDPATVPNPDTLDWTHFDPEDPSTAVMVTLDEENPIDAADIAWKDVVRVNPGELVRLAMPFGTIDPDNDTIRPKTFLGRYMYHCHILEHEDHDMMRHFWVRPKVLGDLMPPHGHH